MLKALYYMGKGKVKNMTKENKTLLNNKVKQIKKQFKEEGWIAQVNIRQYGESSRGMLYVLLFDDDILEYVVESPFVIDDEEKIVKTSTLQVHYINGYITSRSVAKIEKVLGK